jgi:hypothetical protein
MQNSGPTLSAAFQTPTRVPGGPLTRTLYPIKTGEKEQLGQCVRRYPPAAQGSRTSRVVLLLIGFTRAVSGTDHSEECSMSMGFS